jgi:hypothetical protein
LASKTNKLIRDLKRRSEIKTPIATDMFIPNHSGLLSNTDATKKLDDRYSLGTHNHDSEYVNVTGDTMTNSLTLSAGSITVSSGDITITNGDLTLSKSTGAIYLGNSGNIWGNEAHFDDFSLAAGASQITVTGDFVPLNDGTIDLGRSNAGKKQFKEVFGYNFKSLNHTRATSTTYYTEFQTNATVTDASVYTGYQFDSDYDFDDAVGGGAETVKAIDVDIDFTTTNAILHSPQASILYGRITMDADTYPNMTIAPIDCSVTYSKTGGTYSMGDGAYRFGVTLGTSNQSISLKSYVSQSSSGRSLGYQGYAQGTGTSAAELVGVEGFIDGVSTTSRIKGVSSLPAGLAHGINNDLVMAYYRRYYRKHII